MYAKQTFLVHALGIAPKLLAVEDPLANSYPCSLLQMVLGRLFWCNSY